MLLLKHKKTAKGNRILISITVLGSAGPIRFVVNEEELVTTVMDTALKQYAREGRLPVLGSDLNNFSLYCPSSGSDAMNAWEAIGSKGFRNFMLCKKPPAEKVIEGESSPTGKAGGNWKTWLNKSLNRKVSSH